MSRLTSIFVVAIGMMSSLSYANTMTSPFSFDIELSDGQVLTVAPKGNKENQWVELADGDLAVKRNGLWYFAYENEGLVLSTGQPLSSQEVAVEAEQPSEVFVHEPHEHKLVSGSNGYQHFSYASLATQGLARFNQPLLVLRVSFNNMGFKYSRSDFQNVFFSAQDSVKQYFSENSYNRFNVVPASENQGTYNDGIVDVKLNYNHPNFGGSYGTQSRNLVKDALAAANSHINYAAYDSNNDGVLDSNELAVVLIVAGYENAYGGAASPEPRVWAHKAELSSSNTYDGKRFASYAMFGERHDSHRATMGIICHELGHLFFDLPDLYDRTGDSMGIGRWGLMGLGSWNSYDGHSGNRPAHMLAWSKHKAGFIQPEDFEEFSGDDSSSITIAPMTEKDQAMRVWVDPYRHGEHFLLEYRKREKFDRGLPGEGLLITHIDDWVGEAINSYQNDQENHKWVDVEEADGRNDLDASENRGDSSDVFHDGQNYFGSSSLPATLDYEGNTTGVEVHSISTAEQAIAKVIFPYDSLGDNLGYDEFGPKSLYGKSSMSTVIKLVRPAEMTWAHGIDLFMNTTGKVTVSLSQHFDGEATSGLIVSDSFDVIRGWNRLFFSDATSISAYDVVYMKTRIDASVGSALTIDNKGAPSGHTYVASGYSGFSKANFDVSQRLLVAQQKAGFAYRIPNYTPPEAKQASSKKKKGGDMTLLLILLVIPMFFLRLKYLKSDNYSL